MTTEFSFLGDGKEIMNYKVMNSAGCIQFHSVVRDNISTHMYSLIGSKAHTVHI